MWIMTIWIEISDFFCQLHAITGCDTTLYKFNEGIVWVFKKVCEDLFSLNLIKMLGLNIILTEEMIQKTWIFVQTIMYNGR